LTTKPKLTTRQALFVSEILVDGNASAAARRAGYSHKTAEEQGHRLSRNVHVAAEIAKRQAKRLAINEVSSERVIAQLAAIAFADPLSAFDDAGNLRPLDQIDPATRGALVVEVSQGFDQDGNSVQTRKTKFADKLGALDKLARHLGMFNDKLTLQGSKENPLLMLIQRINGQHSAIGPVFEYIDHS
jgi:phage terminase small subunit